MVVISDPCNTCFGRCCCFCLRSSRPKYKEHVRAIYPPPSLPQSVAVNVSALISYASANHDILKDVGRYLAKLLLIDLLAKDYAHVECAMEVFGALLDAFKTENMLALYEGYLVDVIGTLIDHNEMHMKLLGLRGFEKYAALHVAMHIGQDGMVAIASGNFKQLDRFFIYIVPLCVDTHADLKMQAKFRSAGLQALLIMLRSNDLSVDHYSTVLPAILCNLEIAPANDEKNDPINPRDLALDCLRESTRWITNDNLENLCFPIFKHLDAKLWPPKLSLQIFTVVSDALRLRYADALANLIILHIDFVSKDQLKCSVLEVATNLLLQLRSHVGPWQISVQFLIKKLATIADSDAFETCLIACIGAYAVKANSLVGIWDVLRFVLQNITSDLKVNNQAAILRCAVFLSKLHCGNEKGLKLSENLVIEFNRLFESLDLEMYPCLIETFSNLGVLVPSNGDSVSNTQIFENHANDFYTKWFTPTSLIAFNADKSKCEDHCILDEHHFEFIFGWMKRCISKYSSELFVALYRLIIMVVLSKSSLISRVISFFAHLQNFTGDFSSGQQLQFSLFAGFLFFLSNFFHPIRQENSNKLKEFLVKHSVLLSDIVPLNSYNYLIVSPNGLEQYTGKIVTGARHIVSPFSVKAAFDLVAEFDLSYLNRQTIDNALIVDPVFILRKNRMQHLESIGSSLYFDSALTSSDLQPEVRLKNQKSLTFSSGSGGVLSYSEILLEENEEADYKINPIVSATRPKNPGGSFNLKSAVMKGKETFPALAHLQKLISSPIHTSMLTKKDRIIDDEINLKDFPRAESLNLSFLSQR